MQEMLLVGRGGEGVVLASQILADTFARAGFWVQSFPEFKAERRGAPISAFLRWDDGADPPPLQGAGVRRARRHLARRRRPPELLRDGAARRSRRPQPRDALAASRRRSTIARVPASRIARDDDDPLRRGAADGQRRRARRVREAAASRRARLPRAGDRVAHGRRRRAERRRRARGLRAVRRQRTARRRHAARAARRGGVRWRRPRPAALPGEHRPTRAPTTRAPGRSSGPSSPRRAPPAPSARSSARRARSPRDRRRRWRSTTTTARAAGSARTSARCGARSGWRRCPHERRRSRAGAPSLTSDEAAAYAVVLARAQAIGCYPITPQTIIVERLADLVAGRDDVEFANLESEHAMFGYVDRRGARRRPHVHRDLVAGAALRARAAPPRLARARAARRRQRQPRRLRAVEPPARPLRQHEPARHRLDPALLRLGAGGARHRPLRLPDRRDGDAAGDGVRRGLPPLAHLGGRRRPRPGSRSTRSCRRSGRRTTGCSTRRGRARSRRCPSRATTPPSSATSPRRWTTRGRCIDDGRRRSSPPRFGRRKVGALDRRRQPRRPTRALVTIGTIGDTALELLDDDDDLRLVRVHAYRPFPADGARGALAGVSHVARRRPRARLRVARPARRATSWRSASTGRGRRTSSAALGGTDVTPDTLRCAVRAGASRRRRRRRPSRSHSRRGCER